MIFAVGGMVITNVFSIAFAIFATIPQQLQNTDLKKQELTSQNLMTFDGFYKISNEDYSARVMNIIESGNTLYPLSLIHI